ncbi:MAG: ATP-binding cassette domain-containing protein, partial [Clostridiales bacterium]|nr:ATP-binding cassette domain-containing protein [Clostridiales bacterium]
LSGGQKRRVALAGILAMEPEYLILDEPVAGLDGEGKDSLFSLLKLLNEEKGVGILLVSHDMDDVAANAKRVLVMNHGRMIMDGTTREVFSQKKKLEEIGLAIPHSVAFYQRLSEKGYFKKGLENIPLTTKQLADMILKEQQ